MQDMSSFVVRTLLADGVIRESDVKLASQHVLTNGSTLLDALVAVNAVGSRPIAIAQARVCEYPFVDITAFEIDINNARAIPRSIAESFVTFPLFILDGVATVAMADPLNLQAADHLRQLLKVDVDPVVAELRELRALISRAYSLVSASDTSEQSDAMNVVTTGEEPIVAAVNQIISSAIETNASDIHINPDDKSLLLRYRVDGVLRVVQGPPLSAHTSIVQRLKVLAKLDLTQTRKPQDGKFRFSRSDEGIDIRLSIIPTIHGENAVLRLLRSSARIGRVADLGMTPAQTAWFADAISRPNGMILVTGPTGSGKTTTLYTALNHINAPERNIVTIEDPVEIRLPVVRQVQVNHDIGLTFASALRSILRQDPDVVLVGEIRDEETAKIAAQAALTGHLVLSTLHTNDAVGALARLRDFGVPSFAINQSLLLVLAQRLIRRLCGSCARPEDPSTVRELLTHREPDPEFGSTFLRSTGCAACQHQGYKGRLAVYEMLRLTSPVQHLLEQAAPRALIQECARDAGMRLLHEHGLVKASHGLTCLDELTKLRAIMEDQADPISTRAAA
jgi:type IV pilus assembly protein PilB